MKGRKPGVDRLRANARQQAANGADTTPPVCPDWLDKEAKEEWERIVPALVRTTIVTALDTSTLAAYCVAYATWRRCELQVRKDGDMIAGPRGGNMIHPLLKHSAQLFQELRRMAGEFGFTPAARSAVNAKPPEEEDALTQFQRMAEADPEEARRALAAYENN